MLKFNTLRIANENMESGMHLSSCEKKCSIQGFTLLELLFVVAVISIIALLGINTYRHRTLNVKIDRTILEIQDILKAGATFFLNQRKWPKAGEQTGDLFQKQYLMTDKVLINPWDKRYQYEPFARIPTEPEKIKLFQIETIVPTEGIANQIVAKLPNAEAESTEGGYQIKAQILLSGESKDEKLPQYLIHSMGTKEMTKESEMKSHLAKVEFEPPCPKGMKPGLLLGLAGIKAPKRVFFENFSSFEVVDKQCDASKCEFRVSLRYFSMPGCFPEIECWTKNNKKVIIKYIAYCERSKI